MKVVPQIITFLIILAIGWFAYEKHDAFRSLVDDIANYSGFTRPASEFAQPPVTVAEKATVPAEKVVAEAAADKMTDTKMMEQPQIVQQPVAKLQPIQPDNTLAEVQQQADPKATPVQKAPAVKPVLPAEEISPARVDTQKSVGAGAAAVVTSESRKQKALSGLADARRAWHQGEHDKSIMLYSQLMREYENHPDFAGELGNIYFSKGQTELAVNAYSEALLRLLKNNDYAHAEQVLGIIYNIDQEQAALLREYFAR